MTSTQIFPKSSQNCPQVATVQFGSSKQCICFATYGGTNGNVFCGFVWANPNSTGFILKRHHATTLQPSAFPSMQSMQSIVQKMSLRPNKVSNRSSGAFGSLLQALQILRSLLPARTGQQPQGKRCAWWGKMAASPWRTRSPLWINPQENSYRARSSGSYISFSVQV